MVTAVKPSDKRGTVVMRQVLVGSRAGGVGKTTTTMAMADAKRGFELAKTAPQEVRSLPAFKDLENLLEKVADPDITLVDVDVQPGTEQTGSNFARRFPKVVPFALAPSAEALAEDPSLAYSHFDNLGEMLLHKPCLVDFGANVVDAFFNWADMADIGSMWAAKKIGIDFVAPTTADDRAMIAAADAVEAMQRICQPHGVDLRCIIVLNRRDGTFHKYEGSQHWQRLLELGEQAATQTLSFKRGDSELWPYMDQALLTPITMLAMTAAEIEKSCALPSAFVAKRGWKQLLGWYGNVVDELIDMELLVGGKPRIKADPEPVPGGEP